MNKIEQVNYNNDDHLAKLEIFFQKKIDQDKINRKIKNNKKVSKKQRQNPLSFEFDSKQFRLVDKNGVASISTPRILKKNTMEQEQKYVDKLGKNNKKILKNKYELLFEYQDIENYANIYKETIEPLEESNKNSQGVIDAIRDKVKQETEQFNTSRDNIIMEIDTYKELLRNTEHQNKADRAEIISGFLEKQSELYTLNKEYYLKNLQIKEMSAKLK